MKDLECKSLLSRAKTAAELPSRFGRIAREPWEADLDGLDKREDDERDDEQRHDLLPQLQRHLNNDPYNKHNQKEIAKREEMQIEQKR